MADRHKQKRTSRLSVVISAVLHGVIIGTLIFFAAREGMLGRQLKKIAVTMVPKEKPKEKPPEPKPDIEKPKDVEPKPSVTPQLTKAAIVPPQASANSTAAPTVAPPSTAAPAFDFEGGKVVESTSDPNVLYKGFMEYTLRSRWNRPEGIADEQYVAQVAVSVDKEGRITNTRWEKGSGDNAWDNSVKKALAASPNIGRPPPKKFPETVVVRFDVQVASDLSLE